MQNHENVIKWKYFRITGHFICAGISPVPVNSPHIGQWCGALMFTLICARINGWVNNREAGDLRRIRAHYNVIVMMKQSFNIEINEGGFNDFHPRSVYPTNIASERFYLVA